MTRITFLGTGTSIGVPEIGCMCEVCQSPDLHDKRLRCSALFEVDGTRILLDCSPDFRQQMLDKPFLPIDGVLLTHEHYDHVGGLDDLRPFSRHGDVQIFAEPNVCQAIRTRLPYCFREQKYPGVPQLVLNEISLEPFRIGGVEIVPIRLLHGKLPIVGYRIGRVAYLTDVLTIPESEYEKLQQLDLLIVDALRVQPHLSHESLSEALAQIEKIAPKQAYLTHMCHQIGLHVDVEKSLQPNVHLAYDGLVVSL